MNEPHLPDREVTIHCGCCGDQFTVELGGSAYCPICVSQNCGRCRSSAA